MKVWTIALVTVVFFVSMLQLTSSFTVRRTTVRFASGYRSSWRDNDSEGSRPFRRNERAPYGDSNGSSYRDRRSSYSDRNRPSWSRYATEDKPEPEYGRFDGDHLFGINSVHLALRAQRRTIKELIIQSGMDMATKKDERAAKEILDLAREKGIPVREFSKHDLNMMTDSKPHQGFVLRAYPLEFQQLSHLNHSDRFRCVLALDEVWDPQNFGALLRTAYFLQCDKVVVCSKNSAPLSPAVSRASAGAMEVMPVYSTDNMMKFLDQSRENGWQVVGTDLSPKSTSVYDVPLSAPTVLVLGNEGHGIRTNVLRRCTHLVRIGERGGSAADGSEVSDNTEGPQSGDSASVRGGVDSLNVSVTGAIILHHFMTSGNR